MNGYDLWDMFNYSDNERKRDEYKDVKSELKEYKDNINRYLSQCEEDMKNYFKVYEETNGLKGDVINSFYSKSEEYKNKINRYISELKSINESISVRYDEASKLYKGYISKCKEEDLKGREKWEKEHK